MDSKTPTGVVGSSIDRPRGRGFSGSATELAGPGPWFFPSSRKPDQHQLSFKKGLANNASAGRRAVLQNLRSAVHVRNSSQRGGVADEWVTQMLRQSDAKVFKKYSQMKLQMKREALKQMNRQAGDSERRKSFDTEDDE